MRIKRFPPFSYILAAMMILLTGAALFTAFPKEPSRRGVRDEKRMLPEGGGEFVYKGSRFQTERIRRTGADRYGNSFHRIPGSIKPVISKAVSDD